MENQDKTQSRFSSCADIMVKTLQELEAEARDEFGKEQLINQGYIVVDVWEENLADEKIDDTMQKAIEGVEVL